MSNVENLQKHYDEGLQNHRPSWQNASLNAFAQSSRQSFLKWGLPNKKNNEWRFTNPQKKMLTKILFPLSKSSYKELNLFTIHPENVLAIVDGTYREELTHLPSGIRIDTYTSSSTHLHPSCLNVLESKHKDSFDALNGGLAKEILFLTIEDGQVLNTPLTIVHINTCEYVTHCPRLIIHTGPSAKGHLVEYFVSVAQQKYQTCAITNISLEEDANLTYTKIQHQNEHSFHYGKVEISLAKKSSLSSLIFSLGSDLARNNIHVYLNGQDAKSQVDGLFSPHNTGHCDNYVEIHHNAPYTYNDQIFKGILEGNSRGIFTGKIFIHKHAQKVESSQLSRNLLLSPKAQMITRPELEIYADDVKCTHGATTGEINPEEMFYLQTRGITETMARKMLTKAFVFDIIEKQESPSLKIFLQQLLDSIGERKSA